MFTAIHFVVAREQPDVTFSRYHVMKFLCTCMQTVHLQYIYDIASFYHFYHTKLIMMMMIIVVVVVIVILLLPSLSLPPVCSVLFPPSPFTLLFPPLPPPPPPPPPPPGLSITVWVIIIYLFKFLQPACHFHTTLLLFLHCLYHTQHILQIYCTNNNILNNYRRSIVIDNICECLSYAEHLCN